MIVSRENLIAAGVSPDAADRWLAKQAAEAAPASPQPRCATPNGPAISEAEEQRRIRRTAIERGGKVYWLSQARKTQQTAGIPDLWIAFPAFGMWWETKATDGKLSLFQEDFRDECYRNGTHYGSGTHEDFVAWLDRMVVTITPLEVA